MMMFDNTITLGLILLMLCVALALLPPRYDPMVRLKEWIDKKKKAR